MNVCPGISSAGGHTRLYICLYQDLANIQNPGLNYLVSFLYCDEGNIF